MTKTKRLIIIPDVHGRVFWHEAIESNPDAEFLFLGDYLDPYGFEEISESDAFEGLKEILELKENHPNRVTLLWGNHDLHYMYPELMGSRYDFEHAERNAHMFWDHQTYFKMAFETQAGGNRFLVSHAGIGMGWIKHNFPFLKTEEINAELFNDLVGYPPFMKALEDISEFRGGNREYGSMIWADVQEQGYAVNQFPDVVQVFGHTLIGGPFNYEDRVYCLDCKRYFYLDYKDGKIYDSLDGKPVKAIG